MAHLYSIDFVICVGHLADLVTNLLWHWWWTVIFVFNRMMQLVRTHITFGSIVLFLRWILSKIFSLSVRGHFLNFGLRARRIKVLFSKPTLYWCIVKTMYRISPDIRIQVCIDILIHPYPTDENSYLTSVTDAWFHSVWSSHLLYIQQNVVLEKKNTY